jgi:hypothetical protein
MYKTILWSGLLMAVAFGGPISMFRFSDFWKDVRNGAVGEKATDKPIESTTTAQTAGKAAGAAAPASAPMSLAGTPTTPLAEVLRFDLAPADVLRRWPRVSTDLAHLQLHGYRVPLVSGTSEADVAGSLTYYFNAGQQIEHITLHGTTGDPRGIVSLLTGTHGYVRRPNNDPSRLVFESVNAQGQMLGQVIIQSAPVVRVDQPYQRYQIDLTMSRPR